MQVKTGTYTGDGVVDKAITGVGFQPDFVLIKGGSNLAVMTTSTMGANLTKDVRNAAVPFAGGIKSFTSDGFTLGTDARVNANGTAYRYLAVGVNATADFAVGSYAGDGVDGRDILGLDFQPDAVIIASRGTSAAAWRTSDMTGDNSQQFNGALTANYIQALLSDGFELGTNAIVNSAAATYDWIAIKNTASLFKVLTYTGNAVDNRSITGAGFQPDFTYSKPATFTNSGALRFKDHAGDSSSLLSAVADATNRIQAFAADGFEIGSNVEVNSNTVVYYSMSFKDGASASAIEITPTPIVAEAVIPGVAVSYPQEITPDPVVVEVLVPSVSIATPIEITPAPVVVEAVIPAPDVAVPISITPDPVVVEVVIPTPKGQRPQPDHFGVSHVYLHRPDGTAIDATLTPLSYKVSRYQNRVGAWACEIPIDDLDDLGVPFVRQIGAGWKVSILQENNQSDNALSGGYLLYQGIVETREHRITAGGQSSLAMTGGFRTLALVRQTTRRAFEYDGSLGALADRLVGDLLGGGDSAIYQSAVGAVHVKGAFHDLSRYAALIKGVTLGRHAVREGWDHDRPELTAYDGPPDAGVVLRKLNEGEDRYLHETGATGVALIAGTPTVRFDGSGLANRIIAYGSDTVVDPEDPEGTIAADLMLDSASLTAPYVVKQGFNNDNTPFYYIEDEESIDRYGLIEHIAIRTDIKNPNDDAASRAMAANVLYMTAVNEMIKRRSEKDVFTIGPVANGAHIWALPGDQMWAKYEGEVETESGAAVWLDLEKRFIVVERHDESHPSGVRRVTLVLAAPEMEFPVPGLPEVINPFDPDGPTVPEISLPPLPPMPELPPPFDLLRPPAVQPCCDDPTTDSEEGPEEQFEEAFPPPEPGSGELFWGAIFGGPTNPTPPTADSVLLVQAQAEGYEGNVPSIIGLADVDIEFLAIDTFQNFVIEDDHPTPYLTRNAYYLIRATGPAPSWIAGEFTGLRVARLLASQPLEGAVITVDSDLSNEILATPPPFDVQLTASVALEALDDRDAILVAFGTNTTSSEQPELAQGTSRTFNGQTSPGLPLPWAQVRTGPTVMPAVARAGHFRIAPNDGIHHLFVFARMFRLRLPA